MFHVTYDANGGYIYDEDDESIRETEYWKPVGKGLDFVERAPVAVHGNGRYFCGWTCSRNDPGTAVRKGTENAFVLKDTTVYAYWSERVEIAFDGNGQKLLYGGEEKDTVTLDAGKGFPFSDIPSLNEKNYTLLGWSREKDGSDMVISYSANGAASFIPDEDTRLYAVWKENSAEPVTKAGTEDRICVETVSKEIAKTSDKKEVKGASFFALRLQSKTQTKNSVTIKWNKVKGASGYIVFWNRSGAKYKLEQRTDTTKTKYKADGLKAGTYYKFCVLGYRIINGKKQVLAISPKIHVATMGSNKAANISKVKANKGKISLKIKKSFKIIPSVIKDNVAGKVKNFRKLKYESSNLSVAKVSAKGKITARKAGSCVIYVYSQTGTYAKIRVIVVKQ